VEHEKTNYYTFPFHDDLQTPESARKFFNLQRGIHSQSARVNNIQLQWATVLTVWPL